MDNQTSHPGERLVGIKQLLPMIGNPAISTVYRWVADNKFPRPLKIGDSRVAWRMTEIQSWIASKSQTTPLRPHDVPPMEASDAETA